MGHNINVTIDDEHARYADSEARSAVDGSSLGSLTFTTSVTDPAGVKHTDELADWETVTKTAAYTAANYEAVLGDASAGAFSVTLPAPATGLKVVVKKIDGTANGVTIATPGTETIDGDASRTISKQWVSRTIVSDGANYFIV